MDKKLKLRKRAQNKHFRRRVEERLGYALSEQEINQIKEDALGGQLRELVSPVPRLIIYQIFIDNRPCVVLYDNQTQELVTFLTLSMWQDRRLANNPKTENEESLRTTLENSPAGQVLKQLKESK
jgi:hypothetical protein